MAPNGGFRLLLDSNVLIALDPVGGEIEHLAASAIELHRLANEAGHRLYRHPASASDFSRHKSPAHRSMRNLLAAKLPALPAPPAIPPTWRTLFESAGTANDAVDLLHLAAVAADAVDFLVTEDRGLHARASRLRLADRVLYTGQAVVLLRELHGERLPPPPAVEATKAHALPLDDPIFNSLRGDYSNFDTWMAKCRREMRDAWLVRQGGRVAAVAITKVESDGGDSGWPDPTLKICTFKVSEDFSGYRYGELLLKALFTERRARRLATTYVTTYPKQETLITLLHDFGFQLGASKGNEIVLRKRFEPRQDDLDSLQFHIRFGPPAVKLVPGNTFIVPIEPRYHVMLFPEGAGQLSLLAGSDPFGNALKKAYLCRSPSRRLTAGATLLFYRSGDVRAVTAVGVLEQSLVSSDPINIARFVSKRTVFPLAEIMEMSQEGDILALVFRQDRILRDPLSAAELLKQGVIRGAPQSVQAVSEEALDWLRTRIEQH